MLFHYEVLTKEGKREEGEIEAANQDVAVDLLHQRGFVIASISSKQVPFYLQRLKIFERISQKEVMIFSRQLATLFEAKVPLVQSLHALADQTTNFYFRERIQKIVSDIEGGTTFSESLSRHPDIFGPLYYNMIKSGEVAGKLQEVLLYLADNIEREFDLKRKVISSLIYPAFVLTGFFIVAAIMIVVIVPKITGVLLESGQELPFSTSLILGVSTFLRYAGLPLLILLIGGVILLVNLIQVPRFRKIFDAFLIDVPILGDLFRKIYLARFANSLGTLMTGGLPIIQAMQISADVVGNSVYKEIILSAGEAVRGGRFISAVFDVSPEIPPLVTQMIAVGEKTGKLDQILTSLAKFYRREVDAALDVLVSLIEPVLIVILGIGVGFLVAAVLVPVYNLAGVF
ncbi:MAG: type II secretion system F family protein [Parcubacteria group bacterium]|nr:type II secretion system F family protein [Parcubacteria group bacterium]